MLEQDVDPKERIDPEILKKMRELGKESDPSTPVEKRLGVLVKAKYGVR